MKKGLSSAPLLAFFDPLADILFCWYHSQVMPTLSLACSENNLCTCMQMFQRHLQSETRSFSQVMAPLLSAATKIISRGPGSKNKPVLLALCMEVILPLKMHILVKTDRDLVELYSEQKASHAAKLTMDDLKAEIISVLEAKVSREGMDDCDVTGVCDVATIPAKSWKAAGEASLIFLHADL